MAKNHFAIEPPGRISISIPGYDPAGNLKAQAGKREEKRRRDQRRAAAQHAAGHTKDASAPSAGLSRAEKLSAADEAEVEALAVAAAAPRNAAFDMDLASAFRGESEDDRHADE